MKPAVSCMKSQDTSTESIAPCRAGSYWRCGIHQAMHGRERRRPARVERAPPERGVAVERLLGRGLRAARGEHLPVGGEEGAVEEGDGGALPHRTAVRFRGALRRGGPGAAERLEGAAETPRHALERGSDRAEARDRDGAVGGRDGRDRRERRGIQDPDVLARGQVCDVQALPVGREQQVHGIGGTDGSLEQDRVRGGVDHVDHAVLEARDVEPSADGVQGQPARTWRHRNRRHHLR